METSAGFYEPEPGQGHAGKRQIQHCGALKPNISILQKSSQERGIYKTLAGYDKQDIQACLCLAETVHPRGPCKGFLSSWLHKSSWFQFFGGKGMQWREKRLPENSL